MGRTGLASLLIIVAGWAAYAQQQPTIDFTVGLDNTLVRDAWNPVQVNVRNPGGVMDAWIQLSVYEYDYSTRRSRPTFVASRWVRVPSRPVYYNLPIRLSEFPERVVARLNANGVDVATRTRRRSELARSSAYDVCMFITDEEAARALVRIASRYVSFISPDRAPYDARAYDGARVVVLDCEDFSGTNPGAWQGVMQWAACGGTLVLTAPFLMRNAGTEQLAALARVRPGDLTVFHDARPLTSALAPDARVTGVSGRSLVCDLPDATVVAAAGDVPLVFEQRLGAGTVRALTADPQWLAFAKPAEEVEFARDFWSRALSSYRKATLADPAMPPSMVPAEARVSVLARPLLALLIIFVLVMGPANYLVLARLRKKELLIVTAPAATAFFLLAAWLLSVAVHSHRPTELCESINVCSPGAQMVGVFRMFGVMSPRTNQYQFNFDLGDPVIAELPDPELYGDRLGPLSLNDGYPARVEHLDAARWSVRALWDYTLYGSGGARGSLTLTGDGLSGTVRNTLPVTLKDCYLVHKWNHAAVGDIAPGGGVSVKLPLGPPELSQFALKKLELLDRPQAYLQDGLWDKPLKGRRWELARLALRWVTTYAGEPMLIGWGDALVPPPTLDVPDCKREEEHLYIIPLRVQAVGPELHVPVGGAETVADQRLGKWHKRESDVEQDEPAYDRVVEMQFRLPLGREPVRHQQLQVSGRFRDRPGGPSLPATDLQVYDWQARQWRTVATGLNREFTCAPSNFRPLILMPEAGVRVRVVGAPAELAYRMDRELVWMDVSYSGRVVGR